MRRNCHIISATALVVGILGVVAESSAPQALQVLWHRFDALHKEKEDLARQRWQGLDEVEKARIILKYQSQRGPTKEQLDAVTEAMAREILAQFEKDGAQGERLLREDFAHYTLRDEERHTFEKRRKDIVHEVARLGGDIVHALIKEVVSGGNHQLEAREALSLLGGKAVSALISAYNKEPQDQVRAALMEALSDMRTSRARTTFLRGLKDRSGEVRRAALSGLEGLGRVSQDLLLRCLKDEDGYVRMDAIAALGEAGDRKAIPALRKIALSDPAIGKGNVYWLRDQAKEAIKKIAKRTGAKKVSWRI